MEKTTKQKMKEVEVKAQITKARKAYWFEKVRGGREARLGLPANGVHS